jgi:hypothetical protein
MHTAHAPRLCWQLMNWRIIVELGKLILKVHWSFTKSSCVESVKIWLCTPFVGGLMARTFVALARQAPPAVPQVSTGVQSPGVCTPYCTQYQTVQHVSERQPEVERKNANAALRETWLKSYKDQ